MAMARPKMHGHRVIWLIIILSIQTSSSRYLPCNPSIEYLEHSKCQGEASYLKLAKAKIKAKNDVEEMKLNVTLALNQWIDADPMPTGRSRGLHLWSDIFTIAVRDYHTARRTMFQLDLITCNNEQDIISNEKDEEEKEEKVTTSKNDNSDINSNVDIILNGGCHPSNNINYKIDPKPPKWSEFALKQTDLIERSLFIKHACRANLFCTNARINSRKSSHHSMNSNSEEWLENKFKETEIELIKYLNTSYVEDNNDYYRENIYHHHGNKIRSPILCVNTARGACSLMHLQKFFEYWNKKHPQTKTKSLNQLDDHSHIDYSLNNLRIFSLGDDSILPPVIELDGVGLPSKWRLKGKHDAFYNFIEWQNYEYDIQNGIKHVLKSKRMKESESSLTSISSMEGSSKNRGDELTLKEEIEVETTDGLIGFTNAWIPFLKYLEINYNFTWYATNLVGQYHGQHESQDQIINKNKNKNKGSYKNGFYKGDKNNGHYKNKVENVQTDKDEQEGKSVERFIPLPIGVAGHYMKKLSLARQKLRQIMNNNKLIDDYDFIHNENEEEKKDVNSMNKTFIRNIKLNKIHIKTKLLLLNFKARGSLQGSTERAALYRLAGLGSMKVDFMINMKQNHTNRSLNHIIDGVDRMDQSIKEELINSEKIENEILTEGLGINNKKYIMNIDLAFQEENHKSWLWADIEPRFMSSKWDDNDLETYFRELASYHFVLSPRGNGLDCFRTWEALAVGTIPIVKRSGPFDSIYDGLPVLIVDRWEHVTLELLETTRIAWKDKEFPALDKLSWRAWI